MSAPATKHISPAGWPPQLAIEISRAATAAAMADVLEIRRRVFAEEQNVANLRVSDPDDVRSLVALATVRARKGDRVVRNPVATGRLTPPLTADGEALIAWVATVPEQRGRGIGSALMRFLLDAADTAGIDEVALAAQAHAERFYQHLGFVAGGPLYDVRGIPHRRMVRRGPRSI
jgi:predicted GNAT family N-acyltransferase